MLKNACDWFIDKRLKKLDIEITIRLLKNHKMMDDCIGLVIPYMKDNFYDVILKPHLNYRDTIETMFHELYHVYQFASGQLNYYMRHGVFYAKYMGKKYGSMEEAYDKNYYSLPWEQKADLIADRDLDNYLEI